LPDHDNNADAHPEFDARLGDDLPAILDDAWQRLLAGADSGKHPFHTPVYATVDEDHTPDGRVVVLRRADPADRALLCHTDLRSPKVVQLRLRPRAAWTFYDAPAKLQLRAYGSTTVHDADNLADAQWQASNLSSRRCYLAPRPPGEPSAVPSPNLPDHVQGRVPTEPETQPGRPNFAVLRTVVDRLDWLFLHHAGHRRARFDWPADGPPEARWLHV